MPRWDQLWDDLTQEETQRGYLQGSSSHHRDDEENVALAAKRKKKKKKFKKGSKDGAKQHDGEKKDMGKVKCFACQKFGHYAGQCPNKKKNKQQTTASTEIDEFAARFERDFSLFAGVSVEGASSITNRDFQDDMEHSMIVGHSLSATTTSSTWYIDSGASSHMTGDRDMFTEMSESNLEMEGCIGR